MRMPLLLILVTVSSLQQIVAQESYAESIGSTLAISQTPLVLAQQTVASPAVSAGAAGSALVLSSVGRSLTLEKLERQEAQWRIAIEQLIDEQGVYGAGLDEAYRSYGRMQFEAGNYPQAAELFRQAWHVSRVNTGLYSEQQLTSLNQLIETQVELQQWEQVHELHQLSFLIASRAYPPDDLRYMMAAEFYADWKWRAINGNIRFAEYTSGFELAQELSAFYEEVIDRIEHSDVEHTGRLAGLILGKARTDISLARALVRSRHSRSSQSPAYITETQCFNSGLGQVGTARQCRRVRLANYDVSDPASPSINFALGRYLEQVEGSIERLKRINDTEEPVNHAERRWLDSLVATLENESEAVLHYAGFR